MGSEDVAEAMRRGEFVLVYDAPDREGETDLMIASGSVTPGVVRRLRKDAGGLICTTLGPEVARKLGLPFASELLDAASSRFEVLRLLEANDVMYDKRSSFSVTVNHRATFTGIPDQDRARTIQEISALVAECEALPPPEARREFGRRFRSPGHVPLLIAQDGVLASRRGHTELATALVGMAGLPATATICEMLGADGRALGRQEAERYARKHGLSFVEGADVISAWQSSHPAAVATAK